MKDANAYKVGEVIISAEEIEERLDTLSQKLVAKYRHKHLLLIGLLTGATWLTVDIHKKLHVLGLTDVEVDFIKVSSYQSGTTTTQEPYIAYNSSLSPKDRNVLLVDDIVDTGKTLIAVTKLLKMKKVKTIQSFVLLDKPSRRKVLYEPDYCGFIIPNIWVQGRGMDSDGYGRGDPDIRKGPYYYDQK